jgi:hypothetical protein
MVEANIDERIKQLDRFRDLVKESLPSGSGGEPPLAGEWRQFVGGWAEARSILERYRTIEGHTQLRDEFCGRLTPATSYTDAIQALDDADRHRGVSWLASVRAEVMDRCRAVLPLIAT